LKKIEVLQPKTFCLILCGEFENLKQVVAWQATIFDLGMVSFNARWHNKEITIYKEKLACYVTILLYPCYILEERKEICETRSKK
jgi:hypothetical protein